GAHGLVISGSAFDVKVGGTAPNEGNIIAYHSQNGIFLANERGPTIPPGIEISGNSIFNNGALGIDLSPFILDTNLDSGDGLTQNDDFDADIGPNSLQNFPVITNVRRTRSLTISGTFNSTPNTNSFRIEFFSNTVCNGDQAGNAQSTDHGEGEFFLGSTIVNTDANGVATFEVDLPTREGTFITATATDPNGQTSEFSQCFELESLALPALPTGAKITLIILLLCLSVFISYKRFNSGA
ncbi:MAG: hypothetical protein AAF705_17805, partial [Bacteroidota bacterium]